MGNTCNPVKPKVEGGQQCGLSSEILTKKALKKGRGRGGREANRRELRVAPDEWEPWKETASQTTGDYISMKFRAWITWFLVPLAPKAPLLPPICQTYYPDKEINPLERTLLTNPYSPPMERLRMLSGTIWGSQLRFWQLPGTLRFPLRKFFKCLI